MTAPRLAQDFDRVRIGHVILTAKGANIDALCKVCGMGAEIPPKFGTLSGESLLEAWVKQHAHKKRSRGQPAKTTP